jgi:hypothetical protein
MADSTPGVRPEPTPFRPQEPRRARNDDAAPRRAEAEAPPPPPEPEPEPRPREPEPAPPPRAREQDPGVTIDLFA